LPRNGAEKAVYGKIIFIVQYKKEQKKVEEKGKESFTFSAKFSFRLVGEEKDQNTIKYCVWRQPTGGRTAKLIIQCWVFLFKKKGLQFSIK
jgi:hypothetical protein